MTTCQEEVLVAVTALMTRNGGRPVSPAEIQEEMARAGMLYPASTIQTHIVSAMCANAPNHHAMKHRDLLRVGRGQYVLASRGAQEPARAPTGTRATRCPRASQEAGRGPGRARYRPCS